MQESQFNLAARVGILIRRLRDVQGFSQAELANRAGVTQGALSQIEAGKRLINLNTLYRLGDALGMLPSRLLALAEIGPDKESLAASAKETLRAAKNA